MNPLLRDLFAHMEWADAEHWRTFDTLPAAFGDKDLFDRLHHIHSVQHAFFSIVGGQGGSFRMTSPVDFPSPADLGAYARQFHAQIGPLLDNLTEERLHEAIVVPWFKDPSFNVSVEQALTQVVMHSQHHRAQNASRFRALGGKPPTTDLILWYWKKRPPPNWPALQQFRS